MYCSCCQLNILRFLCIRYHVPRSWFKPSGNILVLFEEKGGDPEKIKFVRRKVSGACALVAEDYPSVGLLSQGEDKIQNNKNVPFAHLTCPSNTRISAVKFASFGTPSGSCGSYLKGDCHDPNSSTIVEKVCLFAIFLYCIWVFLSLVSINIFIFKINLTIKGCLDAYGLVCASNPVSFAVCAL